MDGVKAEFVIDGCDALLQIMQTLFNKLLSEGFCGSLAVGVIHALYKNGMPQLLRTIGESLLAQS